MENFLLKDEEKNDDEFYTLEVLDGIETKSNAFMEMKFLNIRFKRTSLTSQNLSLEPSTTKGKLQNDSKKGSFKT